MRDNFKRARAGKELVLLATFFVIFGLLPSHARALAPSSTFVRSTTPDLKLARKAFRDVIRAKNHIDKLRSTYPEINPHMIATMQNFHEDLRDYEESFSRAQGDWKNKWGEKRKAMQQSLDQASNELRNVVHAWMQQVRVGETVDVAFLADVAGDDRIPSDIRDQAIRTLGEIGNVQSALALEGLSFRRESGSYYGHYINQYAIDAAIAKMLTVIQQSAMGLSQEDQNSTKISEEVEMLKIFLRGGYITNRKQAINILGKIGSDRAVGIMAAHLHAGEWEISKFIEEAILNIGPVAVKPLKHNLGWTEWVWRGNESIRRILVLLGDRETAEYIMKKWDWDQRTIEAMESYFQKHSPTKEVADWLVEAHSYRKGNLGLLDRFSVRFLGKKPPRLDDILQELSVRGLVFTISL